MLYDVFFWSGFAAAVLFLIGLMNLALIAVRRTVLPRSPQGSLFRRIFEPVARIAGTLHRPFGIAVTLLAAVHIVSRLLLFPLRPVDLTGLLLLVPLMIAVILTNLRKIGKIQRETFSLHKSFMIAAAAGLVVHFIALRVLFL